MLGLGEMIFFKTLLAAAFATIGEIYVSKRSKHRKSGVELVLDEKTGVYRIFDKFSRFEKWLRIGCYIFAVFAIPYALLVLHWLFIE